MKYLVAISLMFLPGCVGFYVGDMATIREINSFHIEQMQLGAAERAVHNFLSETEEQNAYQ